MHALFEAYLDRMEEIHSDIGEAIAGLPPEALDWSPGQEMNTITILIAHLTGAERYWIGDMIAGEPSGRVRSAEFETRDLDSPGLNKRLADSRSYIRTVLGRIPVDILEENRYAAIQNREVSTAWCLLHALEHSALHLGHIQILRQLWDQTKE